MRAWSDRCILTRTSHHFAKTCRREAVTAPVSKWMGCCYRVLMGPSVWQGSGAPLNFRREAYGPSCQLPPPHRGPERVIADEGELRCGERKRYIFSSSVRCRKCGTHPDRNLVCAPPLMCFSHLASCNEHRRDCVSCPLRMVGGVMVPRRGPHSDLWSLGTRGLTKQRGCAEAVELKCLRWGVTRHVSWWVQCHHKHPYRGRGGQEGQRKRCDRGSRGERERFEEGTLLTGEGGRVHKPRMAGSS